MNHLQACNLAGLKSQHEVDAPLQPVWVSAADLLAERCLCLSQLSTVSIHKLVECVRKHSAYISGLLRLRQKLVTT